MNEDFIKKQNELNTQTAASIAALEKRMDAMKMPAAPVSSDEPLNLNRLPVNPDPTSSQLRGSDAATRDAHRAPNPSTNQPAQPVAAVPTTAPVGPTV